jgi:hypothetical protein
VAPPAAGVAVTAIGATAIIAATTPAVTADLFAPFFLFMFIIIVNQSINRVSFFIPFVPFDGNESKRE